jgi:hypothetical protein
MPKLSQGKHENRIRAQNFFRFRRLARLHEVRLKQSRNGITPTSHL